MGSPHPSQQDHPHAFRCRSPTAGNGKNTLFVAPNQSDAAINPGTSAGVRTDCSGNLIGMASDGALGRFALLRNHRPRRCRLARAKGSAWWPLCPGTIGDCCLHHHGDQWRVNDRPQSADGVDPHREARRNGDECGRRRWTEAKAHPGYGVLALRRLPQWPVAQHFARDVSGRAQAALGRSWHAIAGEVWLWGQGEGNQIDRLSCRRVPSSLGLVPRKVYEWHRHFRIRTNKAAASVVARAASP